MTRFTIQPIHTDFAAEVFDIDLSKKQSSADINLVKEAFWKYAVLVFPDQELSLDQHVEFTTLFGPIEMNVNTYQEEVKKKLRNIDYTTKSLRVERRNKRCYCFGDSKTPLCFLKRNKGSK